MSQLTKNLKTTTAMQLCWPVPYRPNAIAQSVSQEASVRLQHRGIISGRQLMTNETEREPAGNAEMSCREVAGTVLGGVPRIIASF